MSLKHTLENLHDDLDGVRMSGPFFSFSGYFLLFAAAGFCALVLGLLLDKALARPALVVTLLFGVAMVVDAVRVTRGARR